MHVNKVVMTPNCRFIAKSYRKRKKYRQEVDGIVSGSAEVVGENVFYRQPSS